MTFFEVLICIVVSQVLVLCAVGLGGLLVFRTKREAHEPLFQVQQQKGEAFVMSEAPVQEEEKSVFDGGRSVIDRKHQDFLSSIRTGGMSGNG